MGNLGWKTIAGTILIAAGTALLGLEGCIGLCHTLAQVLIFVGTILGGIGLRHAIAKGGTK